MANIIDFSDVQGFEPVPVGRYRAELVEVTPGESKAGNPKIDLRWKLIGGEYDGRNVFDTLTFTEKSAPFVKRKLMAMGFDAKFKGDIDDIADDLEIGLVAELYVIIRESTEIDQTTGEPYDPSNSVQRVYPLSASVDDLL